MEGGDPIADFIQWFRWRPLITKCFMTTSLILAIVTSLGYVDIYQVYYTYDQGVGKGEYWRAVTGLLYLGDIGFSFVVQSYLTYLVLSYSQRDIFGRKGLADYLMLLMFSYVFTLIYCSIVDTYFMIDTFLFPLLYVESYYKPFQKFILVFSTRLEVKYFIWLFAGFNVLMGESFWSFVVGLLVGIAYVKIKTTLQHKTGIDFYPTPSILKSFIRMYLHWADRRSEESEIDYEDADWQ